jgi:tetratricopeptide (TPR) repeat protein
MDAEQSRLHRIAGSLKFVAGDDSRPEQELALKYALRSGDLELEARAWSCLGDAYYMAGQLRRAQEHFSHCIELCQRHGLHRVEIYQHYMLGMIRWLAGDCREGIRAIEHGVELARRSGHLRAEMVARETLGLVLGDAGEDERALLELDVALSQARRMGSVMFVMALIAEKVEILLKTGQMQAAQALAAELRVEHLLKTWWFARAMITPVLALIAPAHHDMNAILDEGVSLPSLRDGIMMMMLHARAAEACLRRENYERATLHARLLLELAPDGRSLERQARQVLALSEYARGSREPQLLEQLAALRSEAQLGGYGSSVALIDGVMR